MKYMIQEDMQNYEDQSLAFIRVVFGKKLELHDFLNTSCTAKIIQ